MVVPEVHEHFFQLAIAVDGAKKFGGHEVLRRDGLTPFDGLDVAAQIRRGGGIELHAHALAHAVEHLVLTVGSE